MLNNAQEWHRLLHHVAVEVLALAQAGRDANAVCTERAVDRAHWQRTARVHIKQKGDAIELELPSSDSMEQILKAIPRNLAEEIVKAAEDAELASKGELEKVRTRPEKPRTRRERADLYPEILREDMKIRKVASDTAPDKFDQGWLQTSLVDPAIKFAVSASPSHVWIFKQNDTNTRVGRQAPAAIDWSAHARLSDLTRCFIQRYLQCSEDQAPARETMGNRAAEGGERQLAQRDCPHRQTNTNSQAQASRQMEGDRGRADQQRPACHW